MKIQLNQTKPVLSDSGVKSYLETLQKCFAIVIIGKAANNLPLSIKNFLSLNSS